MYWPENKKDFPTFIFLSQKSNRKESGFNTYSPFNPNRSLEPKHILFYYRADCLALGRRRSGLRQVTKTHKMPIRK